MSGRKCEQRQIVGIFLLWAAGQIPNLATCRLCRYLNGSIRAPLTVAYDALRPDTARTRGFEANAVECWSSQRGQDAHSPRCFGNDLYANVACPLNFLLPESRVDEPHQRGFP